MERITNQSSESKSLDITDTNIEQLRQIFPEVFSEGKVDFEALKDALGESVDSSEESYQFSWNGKNKAKQIARTPSTGTLRPCKEESVNWESTENLFIEGDNLEVLKLLQKSYHKKVKMIFIDPPYNTGNDFVYKDSFQENIDNYLMQTGQRTSDNTSISSNTETSGRYHSNWLNMIYPRIKLAKNLLCDDGSIFIAIDDNELRNLLAVCNEVFGEDNFVATIIWEKVHTRKNSAKYFSVSHDYIVCFAKNKAKWNRNLHKREENTAYSNTDNDPKGPWKADPVYANNPYSADYKITKPNGVVLEKPAGRYWRFSEQSIESFINENKMIWGSGSSYPMVKRYLSEVQDGLVPVTLFKRDFAGDNSYANNEVKELFSKEKVMSYPKPTKLLSKLIEIGTSDDSDDLILDFFAGSSSTAHAVLKMNDERGSRRKFIMVQLPETLPSDSEAFKLGYKTISEMSIDRIKKADKFIGKSEGVKKFYLDETNIKPWDTDFDDPKAVFLNSIESIKEGRTDEDVLYEVLLKYGIELTTYIEEELIEGKKVYVIGAGALVVCLDDEITTSLVESICKLEQVEDSETTQVVFKDAGFADSTIKTNAVQILKQAGIEDVKSL